jgi:signal peptidase II
VGSLYAMDRLSWLLPTAALVAVDRWTKAWAANALVIGKPVPLVGQSIRLTRVHNPGGVFGVFPGNGHVFVIVSLIVAVALLFLLLYPRRRSAFLRVGLATVLAGAIGNLIDRLATGYVLDFFEIRGFPVFNLADACVTVGAGLIIIHVLFGGERHRPRQQADRV